MKGLLISSIVILNLVALFVCVSAGISGWSWVGAHALAYLLAFVVTYLIWSHNEYIKSVSIKKNPLVMSDYDEYKD